MADSDLTTPPDGLLEPVVARRDALQAAATALESSLAEPSATTEWRDGVRDALSETREVLERHVHQTAGESGLPASVVGLAPRLSGPVSRLSGEHVDLVARQRVVAAMAEDEGIGPEALRDAAADLAALLLRHVRTANDLLVDALEEELGGGD
jgi:hypothetical protein